MRAATTNVEYPRLANTQQRSPGGLKIDRKASHTLFLLTFLSRAIIISLIMLLGAVGWLSNMSRDSEQYHERGIQKAAEYAEGNIQWSRWIDDGWYEFVGVVYYLIGPNVFWVLLANALLASISAVLVLRIATAAFDDGIIGRYCAYLCAFFPSLVYYSCLPLKEAAAQVGLLSITWGTLIVVLRRREHATWWLGIGFAIVAAVRAYLVPIIIGVVLLCVLFARTSRRNALVILLAYLLAFTFLGFIVIRAYREKLADTEILSYYDIDRVNQIRESLSRGNTRMYHDNQAAFGQDVIDNVGKAITGILFFFFSLSPYMGFRERQLAAIPETVFFACCLPTLIVGAIHGLKTRPRQIVPLLLVAAVIVAVYGSATTNAGAMYRWRCQALPFLLMIVVYGAAVRRKGLMYSVLSQFRDFRRAQLVCSHRL